MSANPAIYYREVRIRKFIKYPNAMKIMKRVKQILITIKKKKRKIKYTVHGFARSI